MAKTTFNKLNKSSVSTFGASSSKVSKEDLSALISKKAYELYEKRGRKPGHAMEDWLEAERIVKSKISK